MSKTTTRINKLGTVCVPVSDQDRAIEFYVDMLGFEKRADVPFGNGYRWVEVAPADAVTTIAIVPPPEGKPTGNVETGIGLHTDDIEADHAELKARGVDVDAEISRMGDPVPPIFWLRDPDGNSLMVVEVGRAAVREKACHLDHPWSARPSRCSQTGPRRTGRCRATSTRVDVCSLAAGRPLRHVSSIAEGVVRARSRRCNGGGSLLDQHQRRGRDSNPR